MSGDVALRLLDWERNVNPKAPLSTRQVESIQEMELCFADRPLPAKFEKMGRSGQMGEIIQADVIRNDSADALKTSFVPKHFRNLFENKQKIETAHQFYHWFADVEDDMLNEDDVKYRLVLEQLKEYSQHCGGLLNEVEVCLNHLKTLTQQYLFVSNKTNSLHEACEHLLAEQTKLMNTVLDIEEKLVYFNEADKMSKKLNSPTLSVINESFIPMLARIDECIAFLTANSSYKESNSYLVKFRHCLAKALSLIHTYVVKSLQHSTLQVLPTSESAKLLDNTFTLFYGKFRTNASRIKILMDQIEMRVHSSPECEQLLSDCHQCYFTQRDLLITSSVATTVSELAGNYQRDHCTLVRSGCNLLLHICEDEYQLFFQFFSKPGQQLDSFLEKLCTKLYDTLRPMIIHINHLETLAELCTILKVEMLEEHIHNSANRLPVFEAFITQMLQDVQERLVYRSHIYIQSDILKYKPAPGDLAYPEKLEMMESIAESLAQTKLIRTDSLTSLTSTCSITSQEVASITSASKQPSDTQSSLVGYSPADFHGMWYPTVRRTLNCLSKLYRCIPKPIFQGLSQEALSMCIQSLINAGDLIGKNQTLLDGHLFQIKHLLILREQITPFQVDFSVKETSLDFSKVKSAAVNLLHKRSRLFSFSSTNAVLEFIIQGTPQVTEHFLDSKKDVDNHLKVVCDALIAHCTTMLTGPLNGFLEKANVILKVNDESGRQILLRNQPFASTEQVTGIVTEANRQLKSKLPVLHRSMALYLANRETEAILFRPIKKNVISTYQQLLEIVHIHYSEEDQVIIGCPSTEQVNVMLTR